MNSAASTSTLTQRISGEQAAIEARLLEIEGMENLQTKLRNTRISADEDMNVDAPERHPISNPIDAKRRVLSKYVRPFWPLSPKQGSDATTQNPEPLSGGRGVGALSFNEAIQLEQRAHAQDQERQRKLEEKRKRTGMPSKGEVMSKQEREARIWAFM